MVDAHFWNGKWAGPVGTRYDLDTEWDCLGLTDLREASISSLTKGIAKKQFKQPASEKAWKDRGIDVDWKPTWKIKPKYTAPRDLVVWLKVQHRTLWVAKNGGMEGTMCLARGCRHEESQQHLTECPEIKQKYWGVIISIMEKMALLYRRASSRMTS